MLKIAIVGCGGISRAHIAAWNKIEEVTLTALCDIRPERMEKFSECRQYTDFDSMLEQEEIDILDICLPTYLHADYSIRAMEKGIHVLCEKPISLKAEDVKRVYAAAKKNNVKFMVAQVLRFWPEYEYLKHIFESKKYGRLLSGVMSRVSPYPVWSWDGWMKDESRCGLVPFDLHIHDLDYMVYAFGAPKKWNSHRTKGEDEDYLTAVYEYEDFFITAEAAWYAAPAFEFSATFRFQFEDALIVKNGPGLKIYEKGGELKEWTPDANDGDTGSINLPKSGAYENEIRYFVSCVLEDRFPEKVKAEELESVIGILKSL